MPDEPRPEDGASERDEDLDRELDEFEAELFKAAQEMPRSAMAGPPRPENHLEAAAEEGKLPPSDSGSEPAAVLTDEEIEARLSRVIRDAEAYLGPIQGSSVDLDELERLEKEMPAQERSRFHEEHPDLAERLRELETRAKQTTSQHKDRVRKKRLTGRSEGDSARGLGIGLTVAYTIIGGPLAGAVIGWMIDSNLGTDSWTGICVVIGAVVGIAMALLILNRTQSDR